MNYEERYKKALERARAIYQGKYKPEIAAILAETLQSIFPELAESEDEMIRKELMDFVIGNSIGNSEKCEKYLAWLEKLGEKQDYDPYKATVKSITAMTERYANGNDLRDFYDNVKVKCKEAVDYDKTWLEKTSKQESTDEPEQEFKVGDWITSARGTAHIIGIGVTDSEFLLEYTDGDQESLSIEYINSIYVKWTIQKAWDGDVLISAYNHPFIYNGNNNSSYVGSYCGIETTGGFKISTEECYWTENINIHPATKEQQDYLFKKMREAGYMWDGHTKKVICK